MFDRRSYTFRTISLGASVSRKPRHCRRMSSGEISRCLSPHPGGDALLLFTDGVCINCRGSELTMSEPFLHHIQGDALANRRYAKTVPQTFRAGMRSLLYLSSLDDRLHLAPSGHTSPRPKTFSTRSTLFLTDAMDHFQSIEQLWRWMISSVAVRDLMG